MLEQVTKYNPDHQHENIGEVHIDSSYGKVWRILGRVAQHFEHIDHSNTREVLVRRKNIFTRKLKRHW